MCAKHFRDAANSSSTEFALENEAVQHMRFDLAALVSVQAARGMDRKRTSSEDKYGRSVPRGSR